MPERLSVIVTGSTSGIGYGIADVFAAAGHRVMLNDLREGDASAEATEAFAKKYGADSVAFCAADVSKPDELEAMAAKANAEFGQIDVLVQNAGIQFTAPVTDFPVERWDQIIAVNLSSVFYGAKTVLPGMLERGWGRIINIASAHGLVASPEKSAYVAAKHGVVGLTKVIALETAKTGVTCNAICPGWVLTPLVDKQIHARAKANGTTYEQEKIALVGEKHPSEEFATPEQIGALAVFLSSDAAGQIRGQAMPVDGGWTAQ